MGPSTSRIVQSSKESAVLIGNLPIEINIFVLDYSRKKGRLISEVVTRSTLPIGTNPTLEV